MQQHCGYRLECREAFSVHASHSCPSFGVFDGENVRNSLAAGGLRLHDHGRLDFLRDKGEVLGDWQECCCA